MSFHLLHLQPAVISIPLLSCHQLMCSQIFAGKSGLWSRQRAPRKRMWCFRFVEVFRAWRSRSSSTTRDTQDSLFCSPLCSWFIQDEYQAFKNMCFSPALSERGDDIKAPFKFVLIFLCALFPHWNGKWKKKPMKPTTEIAGNQSEWVF